MFRRSAATATLVVVTLLCVAHAVVRVGGRWSALASIPAGAQTSAFQWIEERVRGDEAVGFMVVGELSRHEHTWYRSTIQSAIVPTRLVVDRMDKMIIVRSMALRPAALRRGAEAFGYEHLVELPRTRVALASDEPAPPRLDLAPRVDVAGTRSLAAVLFALLVPAIALALRRGRRAAGWYLLTAPLALGAGSAAADALGGSRWILAVFLVALEAVLIAAIVAAPRERDESRGRVWPLVVVGLAGALMFVIAAAEHPFGMLDAQSIYNLRARLIFVDPDFWSPFVGSLAWDTEHPDYPPLLSFAVAGLWRLSGGVHDLAPTALGCMAWLGAGFVVSDWARRMGRRYEWTALFAWLLSPIVVSTAADQVCDVPLAAFAGCAWIAGLDARRAGRRQERVWPHVAMAALAVSGAVLVKNEGLALAFVLAVCTAPAALRATAATRDAWLRVMLYGSPAVLLHVMFKLQVPGNDLMMNSTVDTASLDRAATIATQLAESMTFPVVFKGVFVASLVWLAIGWRRGRAGGDRQLGLAIVVFVALVSCVYLVTPYDLDWHLATSLNRVLLQTYLLALILLLSTVQRASEA